MNLRPDVVPSALPHLDDPCTVLSLSRTFLEMKEA